MKLNLLFLLLVVLMNFNVFAEDEHSPNVCSSQDAQVCGHIGHMVGMTVGAESQFVTHLEIPGDVQVSDIAIKLWMPAMGHGSSPLTIASMGVNKYKVTKAFFVMSGTWEVQVQFKIADVQHQLNIPLEIK